MKTIKLNTTLAAVALCAMTALADFNPQYSCDFTFTGYSGSAPLTNFPALIRLAEASPIGFNYHQLRADGADLFFQDDAGNLIECEIETWNPSGESCVWVRVPELTASTRVRMFWGDPEVTGPTSAQVKGGVWAPAAYAGVWHFSEDDGTAYDSTTNALDAVPKGTTAEMVVCSSAPAGYSRTVSSTGKSSYFSAPSYDSLRLGSNFTASGWFHGTVSGNGRIFQRKASWNAANGWETQWKGTGIQARGADGLAVQLNLPVSVADYWTHIVFAYDGTILGADGTCPVHVYCNGNFVGDQSPTKAATDNNWELRFMGQASYKGEIDEFRLQAGVSSADWIKAEYDTVASRSFYTPGTAVNALGTDVFGVIGSAGEPIGAVTPAFGTHPLTDGQTVAFSAPEGEFRLDDGRYFSFSGYRLYTLDATGSATLVADSGSLSGTYTHTAGTAAQIVWKQTIRRGGAAFATTHSSVVTVSGYSGGEPQPNFPVLFRLAEDSPEGFSYADARPDGADILYTTQAGATLPHEIETWDTNGTSFVWVNLPRMELGTKFLFKYGNASVASPSNSCEDVWADAGYAGVWHMAEADAASAAADSTGHGLHAVPGGNTPSEMVGIADGAAGGARVVASNAVVNYFSAPNYADLGIGGTFTIGGWFKATTITSNGRIFCHKKNYQDANGWEVQWNNGSASSPTATPRGASGSTGTKTLGVSLSSGWAYLAWVFDGELAKTYVNGAYVAQNPIAQATDNFQPLLFGSQQVYKGALDEVRLFAGAASASRLLAHYQTVADAAFLSAAAVTVSEGADCLTIGSLGEERGEPTPAYGTITGLADGQTVSFSAPSSEFVVNENLHYRFAGWSLTVTDAGGVDGPPQISTNLTGTYTHVAGTSARLSWNVQDLYPVRATAENGAVLGTGYFPLGPVTLRAVPAPGYRLWEWVVDGETTGRLSETVTISAQGVTEVTALFSPIPDTVGLWTLCGREAGTEIASLANEAGAAFAGTASAVNARAGAGALPTCVDEGPATVIYADAAATNILARRPKSIRFAPAAGFADTQGGGEIDFAGLAEYIAAGDDVTIECFAKADRSAGGYRALLSANLGNDGHALYLPGLVYSSRLENSGTGTAGYVDCSLRGRTTEAWHHVALIYKPAAQKARLFVDYAEATSAKALSILGTNEWSGHAFRLGSATRSTRYTNDHNYNGLVSCLRVTRGEREVSEFMVAAPYDPAVPGETVALFNPVGADGEPATTFRNLVGDTRLAAACVNTVGELTWSADVPGEAIFASAADLAAKKTLLRHSGSLRFADTSTTTSYVVLEDLSRILTVIDDFTVEFFVKNEGTNTWKTAFSANLTGQATDSAYGTKVAVPGENFTLITLQHPALLTCNMGYNMSGGGNWHHVALVYSRSGALGKIYFYTDYSLRGNIAVEEKVKAFAPAFLGVNYAHNESFVGKISALRATRRALAPEEFLRAGPRPRDGTVFFLR